MTTQHYEKKGVIVYFSHGGGPLPILGDESHKAMVDFMRLLPEQLPRPDAVLVISAHWEENVATVLANRAPEMFYDYYGFPDKAYEINYPAPGCPELAQQITELLGVSGLPSAMDEKRGFDHGVFIPMKLMYPEADIPMLQLSLIRGLDPSVHIDLGKALQNLMGENILVVGSGFSFHNMKEFFRDGAEQSDLRNENFQDWLIEVCTASRSPDETLKLLMDWEAAPHARYCHPREEHLLPLHVCQAMANKPAQLIFDDYILGKRAVAFRW